MTTLVYGKGGVLLKTIASTPRQPTAEQVAEQLVKARSAAFMPRDAFAILAATQRWVTEPEAEGWATGNAIPQIALDAIATLPEADRFAARIAVGSQANIRRLDRLVLLMMVVKKVTEAQMDAHFGIAE